MSEAGFPQVGFWWMFAILHDNMRNARDTNQAVNGSLSIFLCVPWMMQQSELVLWHFFHRICGWCCFFQTSWRCPGEGAVWTSLATECVKLLDWMCSFCLFFFQNISVVKPTNFSGFVSTLYAEQYFVEWLWCQNWIPPQRRVHLKDALSGLFSREHY